MKPTIWLILSIISFAIGFTDFENIAAYLGRPLGAIFFGAFIISSFLRDEVRQYEAEQRGNLAALPPEYRNRVIEEELPEHLGTPTEHPVPHTT
jgi:hypothetical protein